MDSQLKFAAIDIGSNAVRLLLSGVFEDGDSPTFRKMSLIRMPIRLGDDAFTQKNISENKVTQLVKTMVGFNHLIDSFQHWNDTLARGPGNKSILEKNERVAEKLYGTLYLHSGYRQRRQYQQGIPAGKL
jgi:hypothetical protein